MINQHVYFYLNKSNLSCLGDVTRLRYVKCCPLFEWSLCLGSQYLKMSLEAWRREYN